MCFAGLSVNLRLKVYLWRAIWIVLITSIFPSFPRLVGQVASVTSDDYVRAEAFVRNHQWDDGLALLLPLLKREPRNLRALNLAGLALTGKGDTTQANQYFQRSVAVNPEFVPALKNLAINEFNDHRFELAERHLLAAVKQVPDDPVVNLYLGEIEFQKHQYQPAARNLSRAGPLLSRDLNVTTHLAISELKTGEKPKALDLIDRLEPSQLSAKSQFEIGLALEQTDLPERSLPYLQAVYQTYPGTYDVGFDLMIALVQIKNYWQAISTARDVIDRGHETGELDNLLAEAYEGNGQTQDAVDALRRAIALNPDDEDNYLDFASLCMNHRSFDDGLKVLNVALQARPKSDRLIFLRGILYAMEDHFQLAEKDFEEASSLAPDKNFGYVGLGVTYIETGNAKQAIQVLRGRIREKPDDASLLYLLGEALLHAGAQPGGKDYLEAQAALEKSIRLNPNLCLPHVSLGTIYLDEDRAQDAVTQFEQARAIDPTEKSAYSHLAVAYRQLGQTERARSVLTSLKEILDQQRAGHRETIKSPEENASGASPAAKPQ